MENQQHTKIKTIYRMLLEMASGNLVFRIVVNGEDKQFDEIATLLNEIAERLQKAKYINVDNKFINNVLLSDEGDTAIIQKVQSYILNHLEEPLPTAKELSKMFGTNEFTLKESFRNVLKTSIYQFYNDSRLNKSHFLIVESKLPFNEIAFLCGFNNYTNFYKAFKKKFNYTPTHLNRTLLSQKKTGEDF